MFKKLFKKIPEEDKEIFILVGLLLLLPIILLVINMLLPDTRSSSKKEVKPPEKTVIVKDYKKSGDDGKRPVMQTAPSVKDAIKQGNFSTAYLEIDKNPRRGSATADISPDSRKKTETPKVRKEPTISPSAPIRYLDESTPRDRESDAVYLYFMEISGSFWPRFCIQATAKSDPQATGFKISVDGREHTLNTPALKTEKISKGVTVIYDMPLDKQAYDIVQEMIKGKKTTITLAGRRENITRTVSEDEVKGFPRIIEAFEAVGGRLDYLKTEKPSNSSAKTKDAKKTTKTKDTKKTR